MSIKKISGAFRSIIWRISRKLYCWARREVSLNSEANGEHWLLAQVINRTPVPYPIFLDIGSHYGDWSDRAQELIRDAGKFGRVHAFEPSADSYAYISGRFESNELVVTSRLGLSNKTGKYDLFVLSKMAGVNSLFPVDGAVNVEQIDCMRLDDYLAQHQIVHIAMVKCDAEGNDLNIILGAIDLFKQGRVDVWQFEYNHRWHAANARLKDVFDFIADKPYWVGKLFANGIETYDKWHPELERFFEANYVLINKECHLKTSCAHMRFNYRNVLTPVEL